MNEKVLNHINNDIIKKNNLLSEEILTNTLLTEALFDLEKENLKKQETIDDLMHEHLLQTNKIRDLEMSTDEMAKRIIELEKKKRIPK